MNISPSNIITLTPVASIIIYSSIIYSKRYPINLQALLPLALAVAVCGIIITHKFPDGVRKKYGVSRKRMLLSDITGHIGPLFALIFCGSKFGKTKVIQKIYTLLALFLYIGGNLYNIRKTYPGVPDWVFVLFVLLIVIS